MEGLSMGLHRVPRKALRLVHGEPVFDVRAAP
jgi:hypothetical protein